MPKFRVRVEVDVKGHPPIRAGKVVTAPDAEAAGTIAMRMMDNLEIKGYEERNLDYIMFEIKRIGHVKHG